jgi:hypothetical protein
MAHNTEPPNFARRTDPIAEIDDSNAIAWNDGKITPQSHWESVTWQLDGTNSVGHNVAILLEHMQNFATWLPQAIIPLPIDPNTEAHRLATERATTSRSISHQIDVALRQAVKTVMCSNATRSNRRQMASLANNTRKQILSEHVTDRIQALKRFSDLFLSQIELEEAAQEKLRQDLISSK